MTRPVSHLAVTSPAASRPEERGMPTPRSRPAAATPYRRLSRRLAAVGGW